jgi:hypothetical protein
VDVTGETIETPSVESLTSAEEQPAVVSSFEDADEVIEVQPEVVIDTTAELLGRAKARRPRTRAAATGSQAGGASTTPRGARKGGTRKTSGTSRRGGRGKKKEVPDDIGNR